ncbi:MAG: phosphate acyltransferase PlsX [Clostridia bacterium]|nr:phosphate acyltransferase PlsX [Clostridia bacterium]MBR3838463.1 phosphate acyltransferase PlsX [Clostridia bacterium]
MKKYIIDIYGADKGYSTVIDGALEALAQFSDIHIVLCGDEETIRTYLSAKNYDTSRIDVIHAPEEITNHEPPTVIFDKKQNSSLAVGIKILKEDPEAVAMISPGNTGAVLVGSIFKLGMSVPLKQPALASMLPCHNGKLVCLIDCGANMDCKPAHLAKYAIMGSVLMKCRSDIDNPKVGLLSVGKEEGKGNVQTKEAFGLIKETGVNFVGNIEGNDVLAGDVDVVVCDGFSGNVLMKNAEANGKIAMGMVDVLLEKEEKGSHTYNTLIALRERLFMTFDFNSQGGATFLGVNKILIKAHGSANSKTIASCISQAQILESKGFIDAMNRAL